MAQTSPMLRRRRLARRLRQLRELAGMTLDEAAPRLDKTRSALSRVEKGQTRADVHLIRSMMDLYDHYDETLLDLAREAARQGWWTKFGIEDRGFIGMETEAETAMVFSLVNMPGLLQTEAYMRALFGSGKVKRTLERLEKDVAARLHRQLRVLDDEFPLELVAIIDEAALRKKVGGAEVMHGQLRHLVSSAGLATVTVQVLPDEAGAHAGMDGAFTILGFADDEDPSVLYVEYPTGSLHAEDPEEVAKAKLVFDRLRSEALSPTDSVAFIEQVANRVYGT